MSGPPKAFVDLYSLPEAQRIEVLRNSVKQGLTVAFMVETNKKADRYLKKLGSDVRVEARVKDPNGIIIVRIGPPVH